jgi:hypothetical protein
VREGRKKNTKYFSIESIFWILFTKAPEDELLLAMLARLSSLMSPEPLRLIADDLGISGIARYLDEEELLE